MKASKVRVRARVSEILRIRIDGAEWWDVVEYVREKEKLPDTPWTPLAGETPLKESTLRWYVTQSDKELKRRTERNRESLVNRHLAQRRSLYAKAVAQGDIRAALACVKDEAELIGLYKPESDDRNEIIDPDTLTDDDVSAIAEIEGRAKARGTEASGGHTPVAE